MAMFEKAQSTTPQQEVYVAGSELWHVGGMGGMQQNPEENHNKTASEKKESFLAFV